MKPEATLQHPQHLLRVRAPLGEVLQKSNQRELEQLGAVSELAVVDVFDQADYFVYSIRLPRYRVQGERFESLLDLARPRPRHLPKEGYPTFRQEAFDILDDWEFVDRINTEPRYAEESKRLLALHQRLGKPWRDFNEHDRKKFITTLKTKRVQAGLVPWVVWLKSKETGNSVIPDDVSDEVVKRGIGNNFNRRLGLILACALSPQQKNELPYRRRIGQESRDQAMREAQVPLLVTLYQDKILESKFFERVEDYTKVGKTSLSVKIRRDLEAFSHNAPGDLFHFTRGALEFSKDLAWFALHDSQGSMATGALVNLWAITSFLLGEDPVESRKHLTIGLSFITLSRIQDVREKLEDSKREKRRKLRN